MPDQKQAFVKAYIETRAVAEEYLASDHMFDMLSDAAGGTPDHKARQRARELAEGLNIESELSAWFDGSKLAAEDVVDEFITNLTKIKKSIAVTLLARVTEGR
jgi:hypothetical protein